MANTNVLVTFLAQDTQLPLASGLTVNIYPQGAAQTPGNLVATGTLGANGTAALALAFSTQYTAVFFGPGAPAYTYNFTLGSGQFVVGPFATVSDQQNAANGFLGIVNTALGTPVKTLIQWGTATVTTGSDGTGYVSVSFAQPFPNGCFGAFPQVYDGASLSGFASYCKSTAESVSGFTANVASAPANTTVTIRFLAIGF